MSLPSNELTIANLLRIAAQDLDGAKQLAGTANRNAPYLCQQAAEKVARAVAHPEGGHAGREHRIDVIVDLLPNTNPLKALLIPLNELTPYATTYRYPRSAAYFRGAITATDDPVDRSYRGGIAGSSSCVRSGPCRSRLSAGGRWFTGSRPGPIT